MPHTHPEARENGKVPEPGGGEEESEKQFSGGNSLFLLMMAEPGLEMEKRFFQSVLHQTHKKE